jgi:hypothetical protein
VVCLGGQAGAVDEESFIEAFEDVKKVSIHYTHLSQNPYKPWRFYNLEKLR